MIIELSLQDYSSSIQIIPHNQGLKNYSPPYLSMNTKCHLYILQMILQISHQIIDSEDNSFLLIASPKYSPHKLAYQVIFLQSNQMIFTLIANLSKYYQNFNSIYLIHHSKQSIFYIQKCIIILAHVMKVYFLN